MKTRKSLVFLYRGKINAKRENVY